MESIENVTLQKPLHCYLKSFKKNANLKFLLQFIYHINCRNDFHL